MPPSSRSAPASQSSRQRGATVSDTEDRHQGPIAMLFALRLDCANAICVTRRSFCDILQQECSVLRWTPEWCCTLRQRLGLRLRYWPTGEASRLCPQGQRLETSCAKTCFRRNPQTLGGELNILDINALSIDRESTVGSVGSSIAVREKRVGATVVVQQQRDIALIDREHWSVGKAAPPAEVRRNSDSRQGRPAGKPHGMTAIWNDLETIARA